jgi:hypothetical protein
MIADLHLGPVIWVLLWGVAGYWFMWGGRLFWPSSTLIRLAKSILIYINRDSTTRYRNTVCEKLRDSLRVLCGLPSALHRHAGSVKISTLIHMLAPVFPNGNPARQPLFFLSARRALRTAEHAGLFSFTRDLKLFF